MQGACEFLQKSVAYAYYSALTPFPYLFYERVEGKVFEFDV
jgi:hypothetical protein